MDYQSEQRLAAWTDRRDGETRAAMAHRGDIPWHAYLAADMCPLCGKVGPHGEKDVSRG